jgi:hypothetical protein
MEEGKLAGEDRRKEITAFSHTEKREEEGSRAMGGGGGGGGGVGLVAGAMLWCCGVLP